MVRGGVMRICRELCRLGRTSCAPVADLVVLKGRQKKMLGLVDTRVNTTCMVRVRALAVANLTANHIAYLTHFAHLECLAVVRDGCVKHGRG
jgi:hypothetical protein